MKKRILSLVLALSLCTSMLVLPAHAAGGLGAISLESLTSIAKWLEDAVDTSPYVNNATYARQHYTEYSYQTLEQAVFNWNVEARNFTIKDPALGSYSRTVYFELQPLYGTDFYAIRCFSHVVVDRQDGLSDPIYDNVAILGYWTDLTGNVAVCRAPTAEEEASTSVTAIPRSQAAAVGAYRMVAYEDLYNLAYDYNNQHNYKLALNTDGVYWAISSRGDYVLANESGLPYGAAGPSSITSGGSRPDVTTNEDHIIDWLNNTVGSNDGVYGFDNVLYDSNNKTYYVDNSVSYENSFNEYYYYNWSYTYNIDYTNITYIGSSAEYTESYECYYTLPDGRSSADLTKEDLEQLNLSMDVVPYIRSSDDTRLRSLYHFDGNTEDSSYWNYATSFDWTSGASLTYLESNAFNGCLYLDELAHDFTITLPSSLGSGDFTVDFRYYQSSTLTPQNDSYISIGGQEVLRLTGSNFTFNGTNFATPVGNWNHLALVRKDGTLYFYLNGVRQGSAAFSNILTSAVLFHFGSNQQTYKYLDELRVTNFAVWESNFTPATVPYDTNLSLVLPTDTVPIADEYWDIDMTGTNLISEYSNYLDNFPLPLLGTTSYSHSSSYSRTAQIYSDGSFVNVTKPKYKSRDLYTTSSQVRNSVPFLTAADLSITSSETGTILSSNLSSIASSYFSFSTSDSYNANVCYGFLPVGISFPLSATYLQLSGTTNRSFTYYNGVSSGSDYTFTMVSSDGSIGSFSFVAPDWSIFEPISNRTFCSYLVDYIEFDGYYIGLWLSIFYGYSKQTFSSTFLSVIPTEDAGEFIYLALEEGTESTVTAELVSGIAGIPADDLNTPTLAVRSDIPMPVSSGSFGGGRGGGFGDTSSGSFGGSSGGSSSGSSSGSFGDGRGGGFGSHSGYQIGGVRPTFAERGYVYAMVESGYITSLQQYTGYAWQAVDGRIWTGSRWIPYSSYNVITLSDMYDIADASGQSGYEYIYSETGFWSWLQKWLMQFKIDLFEKLNGLGSGSSGECKHSYSAEVISDPTCTESGSTRYTCSKCGDIYTEAVSPLGHDYVASEVVEDHYSMLDGAVCPECGGSDFTHTLDADAEVYHCVCSDCDKEFDVDAEFEYGYTVYACTRCGEEYTESNKSKSGLFEAIGDFLADGIQWIGDKLVRLVDAFSGLSDIFRNFAESVKENAGGFPTLFGQVFALIPEDLQTIIWFSLIASVIVAVWKKWFS